MIKALALGLFLALFGLFLASIAVALYLHRKGNNKDNP